MCGVCIAGEENEGHGKPEKNLGYEIGSQEHEEQIVLSLK